MKVMAFNGSPRTSDWNTVTLLKQVLEGAASTGAETELVHLYKLRFSGCVSCFSCKKLSRKKDGVCAVKDELAPVLVKIRETDAFIIGSPIYYGAESSATRAFIERLCFPYNNYAKDLSSLFPRRINTALLYTMNVSEEFMEKLGYSNHFELMKGTLARHFGNCELFCATDTLQYSDYSKYESARFDGAAKRQRHEQVFPQVCRRAFEFGVRLVDTGDTDE